MIRVRAWLTSGGNCSGLRVSGHAGAGKKGEDIVCAAVSVLVDSLAPSLRSLLAIEPELLEEREGFSELRIAEKDLEGAKAGQINLLLSHVLLALDGLAHQYPEYIEFDDGLMTNSGG